MPTFIQELTQRLLTAYSNDLSSLVVMLPSLRARAFFNEAIAEHSSTPVWQPQRTTVGEIMERGSGLVVGESIRLISELFTIYKRYHPNETLEKFYFWGEMLISDFDLIDKYMVDASMLLRNIGDIKEIDADISYLSEEQLRIVAFWRSIGSGKDITEHKKSFLKIWESLPAIYNEFRERLRSLGIGYAGMIYRDTAERIRRGEELAIDKRRFVIAGFNALSASEKILFDYLARREAGAEFYWDYDSYYVDNPSHEAGIFLRDNLSRYAQSVELSHDNFLEREKRLRTIACVSNIVQLKYVARILEELPREELDKRTAIILTDENMLIPLLHSLPEFVERVNVTMGYPVKTTLAYTFVERLAALQQHSRKSGNEEMFYHADVTGLLTHPYIRESVGEHTTELCEKIASQRMVSIPSSLFTDNDILGVIFSRKESWNTIAKYIIEVLTLLSQRLSLASSVEADSLRLVTEQSAMTMRSVEKCGIDLPTDIFLSVLRRHLQHLTIPYEGEPLEGIQIMGILETRNIDFKNVIILSMNDATFPGDRTSESSFIPYNLRAAYAMPTPEQHEAMYAYYFYRLIQRAERVDMLYCSRADEKSTGECSRYIHQLEYESPYNIEKLKVGVDLMPDTTQPIVIEKREKELRILEQYLSPDSDHSLSPTALFRYVECPMKFYFATIAHLRTPDEVSDTVDPLTFGNILHESMQELYTELIGVKNPQQQIVNLRNPQAVSRAVDKVMGEMLFGRDSIAIDDLSGDRQLVRDIIIKYILRGIMRHDIRREGYTISGLEEEVTYRRRLSDGREVKLAGRADRIDEMSDGSLQIIDYKSGAVPHLEYGGMESLFRGKPHERISNIFQTLLYSMMLSHDRKRSATPTLYYASKMLLDGYSEHITDLSTGMVVYSYATVAEEFESELDGVLNELFDATVPFTQVEDEDMCKYCDYKKICRR